MLSFHIRNSDNSLTHGPGVQLQFRRGAIWSQLEINKSNYEAAAREYAIISSDLMTHAVEHCSRIFVLETEKRTQKRRVSQARTKSKWVGPHVQLKVRLKKGRWTLPFACKSISDVWQFNLLLISMERKALFNKWLLGFYAIQNNDKKHPKTNRILCIPWRSRPGHYLGWFW